MAWRSTNWVYGEVSEMTNPREAKQQAQQAVRQRRLPAVLVEIAESDSICFPLVERAAMGASRVHLDGPV